MARLCFPLDAEIGFDAPTLRRATRRWTGTIEVCEGDTIESIASKIADMIASEWRSAMGEVVAPEAVSAYTAGMYMTVMEYLYSLFSDMYGSLIELVKECYEGLITTGSVSSSDGYYDSDRRRGMWISVVGEIPCEDVEQLAELIENILGGMRYKSVEEFRMSRLSDRARIAVEFFESNITPLERIMDGLRTRTGARWWYTVFYTRNG